MNNQKLKKKSFGCKSLNLINHIEIITKKRLQRFGHFIGLGIPLIFGFIIPIILDDFIIWPFWIGFLFLIFSLLKPRILFYPYKLFTKIISIFDILRSPIILGFIFIVFITPIALFARRFGYDPLRQNSKRKRKSSYKEFNKNHKIDLKKIW